MLRYKLGNEPFYKSGPLGDGELIPASEPNAPSFVDLPDDWLPSQTWEGTDEKSSAAVAIAKDLHMKKLKRGERFERLARHNLPINPDDPVLADIEVPAQFHHRASARTVPAAILPPATPSELQARHKGKRAADQEVA